MKLERRIRTRELHGTCKADIACESAETTAKFDSRTEVCFKSNIQNCTWELASTTVPRQGRGTLSRDPRCNAGYVGMSCDRSASFVLSTQGS